jgi:DNA-binding CsgD family transcriptional regulator
MRVNAKGYGIFKMDGTNILAHRVAWLFEHGELPEPPLQVLHKCDNPACVRPKHLYVGTNAANMSDKRSRRRVSGSLNPNAKLTDEQVVVIQLSASSVTNVSLARQFEVDPSTVSRIRSGDQWRQDAHSKLS